MARIPIEPGIVVLPEEDGGAPQLQGSRCEDCSATFHPRRRVCLACHGRRLADVELGGHGSVHACTHVAMPLRPGTREHAGYWVAQVDLDEGPRVQGLLSETLSAPEIGMRVQPGLEVLRVEENGDEVVVHHYAEEQTL